MGAADHDEPAALAAAGLPPQALIAFPNLRHKAALAILGAAFTPARSKALTKRKIVALLHDCARRNDPALVEQILRDLNTDNLRQPAPVELALGQAVLALLAVLAGMHNAVDQLKNRIRCGKDTGLRNMPCKAFAQNEVWLELCQTAADLLTWSQGRVLHR